MDTPAFRTPPHFFGSFPNTITPPRFYFPFPPSFPPKSALLSLSTPKPNFRLFRCQCPAHPRFRNFPRCFSLSKLISRRGGCNRDPSGVEVRRTCRSPSSAARSEIEKLVDDVPDELEHLGGGDERSADPQTQLAADITHQRRYLVLRTLARHQHLTDTSQAYFNCTVQPILCSSGG